MSTENQGRFDDPNDTMTTGRSAEYSDNMSTNAVASNDIDADGDRDVIDRDETNSLISADKVQGTAVYQGDGERVGTIDSLMIDKRSGKVEYAVMSFGGFLGIGERYHPLPWDSLCYDTDKGGYNVGVSADALRGGPSYDRDEMNDFDYGKRRGEIDDYYEPFSTATPGGSSFAGSTSSPGAAGTAGGTMGGYGTTGHSGVGSASIDRV